MRTRRQFAARSNLNRYRFLPALLVLLSCSASLRAEPADDFVAELRRRGWHDTVLDYLEQADQDPLTTPTFLKKRTYEQAVAQTALGREAVSEKQRQALLKEAAAGFQEFAVEQPKSPLQLQALSTAGNVLTELALSQTNKAEKLPVAAKRQREKLFKASRQLLQQAQEPLQKLQELCKQKIKTLPAAEELSGDRQALTNLRKLEGKQAEAQFLLAKLNFERSRTFASDSGKQKKALKTAAADFAKLYEDYDRKVVGLLGRLYQGRCFQVLGDLEKSLECYFTLIDEPPVPNREIRRLVARAYWRRAECHLEKGDAELAIKECKEWLEESRGTELTDPAWLAVSYQLATAIDLQAESAGGGEAKRLRTESRKYYREIAKLPGEFQREAKAKLASGGAAIAKPIEVNSFDEAFTAGKEALGQMNSSQLAARLAKENNPDSVETLMQEAKSHQAGAMQYFKQALQLYDDQTEKEQLVTARYYLCWLNWEEGRLEDAAVIGEFVARNSPESKFAPLAAKLALAAYERMYNEAKQAGEAGTFEAARLASMSELLVQTWPESPEAATGLNLLMNIALRDNRLSEAEAMLERLPAKSRAAAELRLGGALWTRYLKVSQKSQTDSGDVDQLREKASKLLARGFSASQENLEPTASVATGVLYYGQMLLARGEASKAVSVLENKSIGPLTLVENGSEAASRAEFKTETYKVALRAYVSVEPPLRDKAQAMMAALESAIGSGVDSQQKLIRIYVSLGQQLQQQIKMLTKAGQGDKARAVATAFEDLLVRITERVGEADDWKVQSWIAQTNLQIGEGLQGEDAIRYYKQAEKAYLALLSKANQNPKFAPSSLAVLSARKRLADCLRSQARYADAFQNYITLLKEKPNMLELQQSTAMTLQQWGANKKDSQRLEESIRGSMPQANKKNLVWGWLRLAAIADQAKRKAEKRAVQNPAQVTKAEKYSDLFFEARYHASEARLQAARLARGESQKKQLQTLRQSLRSMQQLYPKLGGPAWKPAYENLLKELEQ